MKNYKYKVFFTISFNYKIDKKKTITKFFKSDIDLGPSNFMVAINDNNIYRMWNKFVSEKNLNDLNAPENFTESNVSQKKLLTHRIVNLNNLTEIFLT